MNGPRIAIDFGTTRTKVAHFDSDRSEPRIIELGREIRAVIPSVFYLPREREGDLLVGDDAVDRIDVDPEGIVNGLKREIHKLGRKRCGPGRSAPTRIELASNLFMYIRLRCEQEVFHGQRVEACTLTVPVVFAEQQRECIRQAAELGGFRDIRLLDEPVAAAIAWLAGSGKRISDAVVVCDVGGGTTDFALLRWAGGRFQAHPEVPAGGFALGGNDVDEAIWERALEQCGADETNLRGWSAAFLVKLRAIKEWLGRSQSRGRVSLQDRVLDVPDHVATECVHEFVARVQTELQKYLGRCRIEEPPVLLVGGASRLFGLKEALEQLAPDRVFRWNDSDYATVLGAVERPDAKASNSHSTRSAAVAAYRETVASAYSDKVLTSVELDYLRERQRSRSVPIAPAQPPVAPGLVHDLVGDGQCVRAFELLSDAMVASPSVQAFELWVECAFVVPDVSVVLDKARELHRQRAGDTWSSACLSVALAGSGRTEEAAKFLEDCQLDDNQTQFAWWYAWLFAYPDNPGNEVLKAVASMRPNNAEIMAMRAMRLASSDRPLAARLLLQAATRSPHSMLVRAASVFLTFDELEDAAAQQKVLDDLPVLERIAPRHALTYFVRAIHLMGDGDFRAANDELGHALEDTRFWQAELASRAMFYRASCCAALDDTDGVLLHGEFLRQEGQTEKALDCFEHILRRDPSTTDALVGRGWCRIDGGSFVDARNDFEEAWAYDPSNSEAIRGAILSAIFGHLHRTGLADGQIHIYPNIPPDKLANAIGAYAGTVQAEEVVCLYDNTVFGSSKNGLCISLHALSWHDMNEQAWQIDLAAIEQAVGGRFGNMRVLINGSHTIEIRVGDDRRKIASTFAGLLRDLGRQARRLPRPEL